MPIFKSRQKDIDLPTDITIWDWLFDPAISRSTPFLTTSPNSSQLAGYEDAFTKERLSWADVRQQSIYISTALVKKYNLKPDETVSLFSRNTIYYPLMMFSVVRAGAVVSGASPAYNVDEMTYALQKANARFLATSPTSIDVALKAAENVGITKDRIFLLEGEMDGFTTIKDLVQMGKSYGENGQTGSWKIPKGKQNKDVCAFLSFSSGTTGLPKAVMIAHQNVIAQALQVQQVTPATHRKVLGVLPLFHITGLVHGLHLPIILNAEVIMLPTFTMPSMLQAIVDYQIEELLIVPPILIRMVRDPVVEKYDLRCVKRFSSGAAPLSEEILQLLQQKFPNTGFKQGYGMTESCSCITAHPPEYYDYRYAHAVGTIVASTEVKIIDEDGKECDVGQPGEILARGPQIVMGYLNNEKATNETFDADGFLHTGDQGFINEQGLITITDRIKEMIKVKGIGVAPAELEDLLLGHPKVEDVASLAIPDDYSGELPKAYITLKSGVDKSEEVGKELIQYVKDNRVRHKWVKEIEFIDEIPKSASGKILRRILRDMQKQGKRGTVVRDEGGERAKL